MRVNYTNFKTLEASEGKTLMPFMHSLFMDKLVRNGKLMQIEKAFAQASSNVHRRFYATLPFMTSVNAAKEKIWDIDLWKDCPEDTGIILHRNGWFLYSTTSDKGEDDVKISLFAFSKNQFYASCAMKNSGEWVGEIHLPEEEAQEIIPELLYSALSIISFIHFCDIETKLIPAGKRDYWKGEKVLNETRKDFVILDCSWFTQIVAEMKQDVKGHLKWQPYGPGSSLRKLIYVVGYDREVVRRAKKEIYL